MPEKLTIIEDQKIIHIEDNGIITEEDLKRSLDTVLTIREKKGFCKILVDTRKAESYPTAVPLIEFGKEISYHVSGLKFAVVKPLDPVVNLDFLITASNNRGAIFQIFETTESAIAWLKDLK